MNLIGGSGPRSERRRRLSQLPARRWLIAGVVQGAGFRPLVCRLARSYYLRGWVRIYRGHVEIVAAGTADQLQAFESRFVQQVPATAHLKINRCEPLTAVTLRDFRILASETSQLSDGQKSPDPSA